MKWTGSANIDLILDPLDNIPIMIEINPRVGATIKIAFTSGVDTDENAIYFFYTNVKFIRIRNC